MRQRSRTCDDQCPEDCSNYVTEETEICDNCATTTGTDTQLTQNTVSFISLLFSSIEVLDYKHSIRIRLLFELRVHIIYNISATLLIFFFLIICEALLKKVYLL